MPSKLAWHFQNVPGWAAGAVNSRYVKLIDPPATNLFPSQRAIGRVYVPDEQTNTLIRCGAQGAAQWIRLCEPTWNRAPWVWAWELPNEPQPMGDPAFRLALVDFTSYAVGYMQQRGLRTVALCLGVGWPDVGTAKDLARALDHTDYWALHEYAAPNLRSEESWLCLRYRRTVAELQAVGARIPPLLITECGIDGGVCSRPGKGWKTFADMATYLGQLVWYDRELRKDPYVEAATIFVSGPNGNWADFDVDEPLSDVLHTYIAGELDQVDEGGGGPVADDTRIWPALGWPIENGAGVITQEFGDNAAYYQAKLGLTAHNGRDLSVTGYDPAAPPKIVAMHDGQVWAYQDTTGFGNTVEVWFPCIGKDAIFKSIYGHMKTILVADKLFIKAGQVVGEMGWTGLCVPAGPGGAHVHVGIKPLRNGFVNLGYRNWVDPRFWMRK